MEEADSVPVQDLKVLGIVDADDEGHRETFTSGKDAHPSPPLGTHSIPCLEK